MPNRPARALLVLTVLVAVTGCGEDRPEATDPPAVDTPAVDAQWSHQELAGQSGPDSETLVDADGDQVVVAMSTDDGAILGFATDDDGTFQAGAPTDTGLDFLALAGTARLGDRWVTLGSGGLSEDGEDLLFATHAFASEDGRTWSDLEATGLEDPADIHALAAVDGGLVAVGSLRTAADPASGGFQAAAWTSADGVAWTTVPLPGDGRDGYAIDVVVTEDEVLAAGSLGDRGVLWSSTDAGASWAEVERPGLPATSTLGSLVAQDDVLMLSGGTPSDSELGYAPTFFRSTDAGRTWTVVSEPPPLAGNDGTPTLTAGGGHFFTTTSTFLEAFRDPELCYADLDLCLQDSVVSLYASDDGDHWRRIDTSGIGDGEEGEVDHITATDDGRIVALRRVEGGTGVWTWPAGVELPGEEEPTSPTSDVVILDHDDVLEPGVTYGAPLYIHCGMDWFFIGDEAWQRTDQGPDVETGAGDEVQADWPVAQQTIFGFATLLPDGTIEYSIGDGEVIATYERATTQPPGCD